MKQQQGATMIIVLVVLLLIAVAGMVALRSGVFGMRLSTNTQAGNLLINNNDSALTKFESMDKSEVEANFAQGGMYNFLLNPANATKEMVFCYNAKDANTFAYSKAAVINEGNTPDRVGNFCTTDKASSGRNAVITQVHMRRNTADDRVAEGYTVSSSVPTIENRINLSLSSISVMPTFTNSTITPEQINGCLQKTAFEDEATTQTNAKCLQALGVAYEVQSVDFESGNAVKVQ